MMWVFHCSKLANGCNISFNCHFIISYVARFWNHHERRLLRSIVQLLSQYISSLLKHHLNYNSNFTLYICTRYYCRHYYGWWDRACLDQKNIKRGVGEVLHWDLRLTRATTAWASWSSNDFTWWSQESSDNEDKSDTASSEVYKITKKNS